MLCIFKHKLVPEDSDNMVPLYMLNKYTNLGVQTQRTVVKPSLSNDDRINFVHSSVKKYCYRIEINNLMVCYS